MTYHCENIEISDSGIAVQVLFDGLNGNSELYFLIQKFFGDYEDEDEGSYIETHNFDLAGHFRPKIKLGKSICEFEYDNQQFIITFEVNEKIYKELNEALKILGSVEKK